MMNLQIDIEEQKNKTIVSLGGELDIYTAPSLKEKLLELISEEGHTLEVDLENVSYMDSTGIGVFINVFKNATATKSHLRLINLTDRVSRLFEITGLDELIEIESTSRGGK